MIRLEHHRPDSLAPLQGALAQLAGKLDYPLDGARDAFTIDHGADYAAFFARMGEAHFLLARAEDRIVATLAGVRKPFLRGKQARSAIYLADLKVDPHCRGGRLARRMLWAAARIWLRTPSLRLPWLFAVAMQGSQGDLKRSARRFSLLHLLQPVAQMQIYFVEAPTLLRLDTTQAPTLDAAHCLDLSPCNEQGPAAVSTRGQKDLRLRSTQAPWPLLHLRRGPQHWRPGPEHDLLVAALQLNRPDERICFALDLRLSRHSRWLQHHGILPSASCIVYGSFPRRFAGACQFAHLNTAEI